MRKEKIWRELKNSKFTRICVEDHLSVIEWLELLLLYIFFFIQILITFGRPYNWFFWDIRLKIYRLPKFNMLFQFPLRKFYKSKVFLCLQKVDHVTDHFLGASPSANIWFSSAN